MGVEVGDGHKGPDSAGPAPLSAGGSFEKGTQLIRELLNFSPMSDDDTRRTRLDEGMKELETRMGGPAPLAGSLHQALSGAVFPLSAEQLLLLARENEAPSVVLSLLSNLPRQRYDSLEAIQQAVESQAEAGEEATEASHAPMPSR